MFKILKTKITKFLYIVAFTITIFTFCNCGNNSDDENDFVAPAIIDIKVKPSIINTGDKVQIDIEASQVHENGILLKVRFEKALKYINQSSYLSIQDKNIKEELFPLFDDSDAKFTYLVYFLSRSQFGSDNEGKIVFELKGIKSKQNATLEIDPDIDNPNIPNDVEFNVQKPEFSPNSVSYVTIR